MRIFIKKQSIIAKVKYKKLNTKISFNKINKIRYFGCLRKEYLIGNSWTAKIILIYKNIQYNISINSEHMKCWIKINKPHTTFRNQWSSSTDLHTVFTHLKFVKVLTTGFKFLERNWNKEEKSRNHLHKSIYAFKIRKSAGNRFQTSTEKLK